MLYEVITVRVGQTEAVRHGAVLERLAQLVGASRPGLTYDMDRVR